MVSYKDIVYKTPRIPHQLRLDTTTQCNASCLSCHRHLSNREGEMPFDLIERLVNDVARWNPPLPEIIPVNYGEFFMREDWLEILEILANKIPQTSIVLPTNGALLTEEKVTNLCNIPNLGIINFSINAFFDETYEAFMGLKASNLINIEDAMRQIAVQRPDIAIWASMVFDPQYSSDLQRDLFYRHWSELSSPQILTASSAGRGTEMKIPRKIPCRSIFSDIVVGYDGKLSSCCWDSRFQLDLNYYSGDLLKDWQNKELIEIRRIHNEHRREEIDLCKFCSSA